ncbi:MAG: hypothetical protein HC794_02490 [Nitrospiraceae bacterium]|nr:hypothetical protein [Nitrospiraceae bacterium]
MPFLAHRVLERWDFVLDPSGLGAEIGLALQAILGPEEQSYAGPVTDSVNDLLATFGRSEPMRACDHLRSLVREVPFIIPWGNRQVMEGVIDLMYRLDGELWIADYKTDAVSVDQAAARAEHYRTQSEIYKVAVQQSLGTTPRFHCLFLRCGAAIEL